MDKFFILNKSIGETPLTLLEKYRIDHPEFEGVKIGYAGRLDPMAEGSVLYLVGDENKNRAQYLGLDKKYRVEVLFGVGTDTYDVLGLVTEHAKYDVEKLQTKAHKALEGFVGEIDQAFPPYSSKVVRGKPLYYWAREGVVMKPPSKKRMIYKIEDEGVEYVKRDELRDAVFGKLAKVRGNFRQVEIKKCWETFFETSSQEQFARMWITVTCSSGTYMRSLAHEIGREVGIPAIALSIVRTEIIGLPEQ